MKFSMAIDLFKNDKFRELSSTHAGMKFLKLRSLSRKEQMKYLIHKHSIDVPGRNSRDWLNIIYESSISLQAIDEVIIHLYEKERVVRKKNEEQLINELYKIQSFEWGGLHENSLEKTIVDKYVKKISSYNSLSNAIENHIHSSVRAYVRASWYNHWSSIIIEDVFKDHSKVVPAIGLIKKIDFFVDGKPFDLKVTHFPEGYIRDYRKSQQLRPELTLMKRVSKQLNIKFEHAIPDSALILDLWRKLDDHPDKMATELICELQKCRKHLLNKSIDNPKLLARWLYENQGVRRFDAANRLFLVLVDKDNFFDSWKLKRARPLIAEKVNAYLNKMGGTIGFQLKFDWDGTTYISDTDVIFVVK